MHKITILIPTHGRNSLLERALNSIAKCEFPENYSKTIVIENGPKEKAEEVCAKFASINCEYQYSALANKSTALNTAIETIEKDSFIIFFDDDIRVHADTIKDYAEAFEKYGENYFYGGPFGVDYEKRPNKNYIKYFPLSAIGWTYNYKSDLQYFDFIGFNWAVQVNKIRELGGFDKRFGPNSTTGATGQEHDMMMRLYEIGIKPKYVEKAKVWHYVPKERSSFKWLLKRRRKAGRNAAIRNAQGYTAKQVKTILFIEKKMLVKSIIKFSKSGVIHALVKMQFYKGFSETLNQND